MAAASGTAMVESVKLSSTQASIAAAASPASINGSTARRGIDPMYSESCSAPRVQRSQPWIASAANTTCRPVVAYSPLAANSPMNTRLLASPIG